MAMSKWWESLRWFGVSIAPGVGGFWHWWWQSLLAWLPMRCRVQMGLLSERLLLSVQADGLHLVRQCGDVLEPLVQLPWPITPQELSGMLLPKLQILPRHWLLPATSALCRPLRLPAGASQRLHDVVRFEIDRQTPFQVEQVYYDVRLLKRHGDDAQLETELVVVPRRLVDGPDGVPKEWATTLAGIDVADMQGQPLNVNLLPPVQRWRCSDPMRRWNLALAAVALLLVATAGALLLNNRIRVAEQLRLQVQAQASSARRVAAERQRLVTLIEGVRFLDERRTLRPKVIEVWEELSRRLPNGTYLEKFAIEDGQLHLMGMSNDASSLVRLLEGSKLWRTPSLSSVLQSNVGSSVNRFVITAELVGVVPMKEAADGKAQR
ncbi:general secretion pathway protein GspL [Xylella fastidiosa subsp. fastidiosa]|jgi:general secretion pathway protein L|nr:Fimbrial assembly family protein [Xylella fastidiosa M23]ADN63749.1 general secretion pathway protein L [Xylella fastidiosa subsp. fastidiosa GB514]EGO82007.1 Fimbrial assembly protein PilN [Xylella fastidiosa EB92.1]KAF0570835.1 general secretion pathway protein L [Xylella fastidiosa subsp. fastidiosa Mus-1]MBE0261735.1 general secretion pathway protein GspL [Xylella fastidiosa subsp. fastidiosa]QIS26069.1 general secretion pathway protein GspL [Xylella fastidiosa]